MDRRQSSALAWALSAALLVAAVPLATFNALQEATGGRNEELGVALAALALGLLVVGAALRWGWRSRGTRVALGIAGGAVALFLAWVGLVLATLPQHGTLSSVDWERLPDGETVPALDASRVPPRLLDAVTKAPPGGSGSTSLSNADARSFWRAVEETGASDGPRGYVVAIGPGTYAFRPGPALG
jgi:hypothetical protein